MSRRLGALLDAQNRRSEHIRSCFDEPAVSRSTTAVALSAHRIAFRPARAGHPRHRTLVPLRQLKERIETCSYRRTTCMRPSGSHAIFW